MSEYQYYEFQAVDRPLTDAEVQQLRSVSSRARITPTSFVNEYQWGNFKGDEDAWMERYFDAFLYFANWGARTLKLRLPARLLDPGIVRVYCHDNTTSLRQKNGNVILTFCSENDAGDDAYDDFFRRSSRCAQSSRVVIYARSIWAGWLPFRAVKSMTIRSSRRFRPGSVN